LSHFTSPVIFSLEENKAKQDVVVHACNLSTEKAAAGRL
jgi:hypothetical protein